MNYDRSEISNALYRCAINIAEEREMFREYPDIFDVFDYDSMGTLCNELGDIIYKALMRGEEAEMLRKGATIAYKGYEIDVGLTYKEQISVQYCGDDLFFGTVEDAKSWIDSLDVVDGEGDDDDDDSDYCIEESERAIRSSTGRDYGPSNPWDAPGMSVSDFIKGVSWY